MLPLFSLASVTHIACTNNMGRVSQQYLSRHDDEKVKKSVNEIMLRNVSHVTDFLPSSSASL